MPLGFILHPTWFTERGRPVVHLFGRLDSGETFVVRDDRSSPHFFVRTRELAAAEGIASFRYQETGLTTTAGEPVSRVFAPLPPDLPKLKERMHEVGIRTYEADVAFATRFLMDAGIRGSVRIEGRFRPGRLVGRIYHNPELLPEEWVPRLTVLSLDIETDPDASRILSVALWGTGVRHVLVVRPEGTELAESTGAGLAAALAGALAGPDEAPCSSASVTVEVTRDEHDLLTRFLALLRAIDPDVLTGWNLIDFDLRVLQNRFDAHRIPFELGRAEVPCRLLLDGTSWGTARAILPGRIALDGLALLRMAFVRLEDYRLETAARTILGRGKSIAPTGNRADEILRLYREDLLSFLGYNLNDARLVYDILEAKGLVDLAVRHSLLTGLPPDRTGASIAAFDFLYLAELHRRGKVAPTLDPGAPLAPTAGGFVLSTVPGIYDNVAVLDYRSLYPSVIRTFRLDPLSLVRAEDTGTDARHPRPAVSPRSIRAPNGARFELEGGILPEILDRLFPLRQAAIERGDAIGATALKILMNSFYGVLATPRCRFYSPETANAITGFGQQILLRTRDAIERRGYRVLYGDTDSIFVEIGARCGADTAQGGAAEDASMLAARLAGEIDLALADELRAEHGVESRLRLRFDLLYRKLLLPARRGSAEGSMKRYAGLTGAPGSERIVFVGLESVRRDWTDVSKLLQRGLVERAFRGEAPEPFLRDFLVRFRSGEFDGLLVYRKALRKPESEYQRSTPAHVQAARMQARPGGRVVRYVMTTAGPEPEEEQRHPIDRAHYVDKQLRPVAESILALFGTSWERVAGNQGLLPF